ncbi:glycosyltransferase [Micromonospora avicenniae]|uniref:Glycosyltransferase involved in cell wall bisynthesis n=1 Tax=Micromonospora avicenniae TaxID=1198245 RepID=A0A1N6X2F0_9ACTN|nr:glycosyltransferase [Micromonospora avicenniae]SIQ96421.1 Glycosyltransferase involved in cell wall bisynthesis [Micromonospora avicenniae]
MTSPDSPRVDSARTTHEAVTGGSEWIAYVGPFTFPWGQPGSRRVLGVAGSLALAGHRVVVVSGELRPQIAKLDVVEGPGSVHHLGIGELPTGRANLLTRSLQQLVNQGQRTVQWLESQPGRPSHVFVYGGHASYMFHLRPWCRRNGIPLVADVVEWYDRGHLRGGPLGPLRASSELALRYYYPRCDGVIAISSFLEEYYDRRGVRTVRVPPTLDVQGMRLDSSVRAVNADLTFVYFGTPGKKDLLATMVHAVCQLEREGVDLEFRIHGPSRQQVQALLGGKELPRAVRIAGRLPQQEVPPAVQAADFSVILRRPERFAQAGFPTKFCESLANGTPVIANLTSDLGSYLRHGVEGLVAESDTLEAIVEALRAALKLSPQQRLEMRRAARQQAVDSFDYRRHASALARFAEALRY